MYQTAVEYESKIHCSSKKIWADESDLQREFLKVVAFKSMYQNHAVSDNDSWNNQTQPLDRKNQTTTSAGLLTMAPPRLLFTFSKLGNAIIAEHPHKFSMREISQMFSVSSHTVRSAPIVNLDSYTCISLWSFRYKQFFLFLSFYWAIAVACLQTVKPSTNKVRSS